MAWATRSTLPLAETQFKGISRVCFVPGEQSTIYPTAPIGLVYPGDKGCKRCGRRPTNTPTVGPRVGFAYTPGGSAGSRVGQARDIHRGGFGIYYNRSKKSCRCKTSKWPPLG